MFIFYYFLLSIELVTSWEFKPKIKSEVSIECLTNLDCGQYGRCDKEISLYLPTFPPSIFIKVPKFKPTPLPTLLPTRLPTLLPTPLPTRLPTRFPTPLPTRFPTPLPSRLPSRLPTRFPTQFPTMFPILSPTPFDNNQDEQLEKIREDILSLVNQERLSQGLGILCRNSKLDNIAQLHSQDQDSCSTMSHSSCDGRTLTDRLKSISYQYGNAGENVAWNQRTPKQVMNSWMNSPGHRANILNKNFKNIGIGLSNNYYWTQVFGTLYSGESGCIEIERRDIKFGFKKQCTCYTGYFTLNNDNPCSYKVKSLIIAFTISLLFAPLGAGNFYMGWYILGTFNLIFGTIALFYYLYHKRFTYMIEYYKYITIIINLLWFVFWLIGIIYLATNPIDNNGVKAIVY